MRVMRMGEEPGAPARRAYAVRALGAYWPTTTSPIFSLPIATAPAVAEPLPPRLEEVALPEWATDLAPEGTLPVPAHCIVEGSAAPVDRVDWLGAACWYLNGAAERAFEQAHGPIHSYSYKLTGWPPRMWERAWANRIALFLRRWAARDSHATETELFGPLPKPQIVMSHDVDAIRKTWPVRSKQSLFHLFNSVRRLKAGDLNGARRKAVRSMRFAISRADYETFDELLTLERDAGVVGHFMVYGRAPAKRTGWLRLLDPDYDVMEDAVATRLRGLIAHGGHVGLHPSFQAWDDAEVIKGERLRVERACGAPVTSCRQHWLKFSWTRTWLAQQNAGLTLDMTLGFNDRPGFRNGAALRFAPVDVPGGSPGTLESIPLVLMDSQLYDYSEMTGVERAATIKRIIDEVVEVRGTASVLWHPHTLTDDYGWRDGFRLLLQAVAGARS